jgi:hypothetical protein
LTALINNFSHLCGHAVRAFCMQVILLKYQTLPSIHCLIFFFHNLSIIMFKKQIILLSSVVLLLLIPIAHAQFATQERILPLPSFRKPKNIVFSTIGGGSSYHMWVFEILKEMNNRGHKVSFYSRVRVFQR